MSTLPAEKLHACESDFCTAATHANDNIVLGIQRWLAQRRAESEIVAMNHQELKDLGFPMVFDNEVIAPGRRD